MAPLPFLPVLSAGSSSADLLPSLAALAPIVVPLAALSETLPSLGPRAAYWVDASSSSDADAVTEALNNGAGKAVVGQALLAELAGIDASRLVLDVAAAELGEVAEDVRAKVGGVQVRVDSLDVQLDLVKSIKSAFPTSRYAVFLASSAASPPTPTQIASLYQTLLVVAIPSAQLVASSTSSDGKLSIAEAFLAPLSTDRQDGLYPTIVSSSTHSSRPLGLVYSSKESISESILTLKGVYQSRKHGLWRKGETSGSTQKVVRIEKDCDSDAVVVEVEQAGTGFCHLGTTTCFGAGELRGVAKLEDTLVSRIADAPEGSYTARLFGDEQLLRAKIMEEAEELCDATEKADIAFEAADLVYFAMARCVKAGVQWRDVEAALDEKAGKVKRRKGDAKPKWESKVAETLPKKTVDAPTEPKPEPPKAAPVPIPPKEHKDPSAPIRMATVPALSSLSKEETAALLVRPVLDSNAMMAKVTPIIDAVRTGGDEALTALTAKFDRLEPEVLAQGNVLLPPFAPESMVIPDDLKQAIDQAYANVLKFHQAQAETEPLIVETMPGVVCSRFARAITRVGVYVPGGTAILPSSAIMLGVPAKVAGCSTIVLATPPRKDGTISPEVLYVASLVGVTCVVKAGGAQAVAAMAYGTETIPKVDKIVGPGNQWVTAAKMVVQNDVKALVSIDMPAGPSEVLVIADGTSNPTFVASDLLSQAEHGVDSQVVLVAIDLTSEQLSSIEEAVDSQARALPRCDIARVAIEQSIIVQVKTRQEAMDFSNEYAPEHLIMQVDKADELVPLVVNAGSVFVGHWSPESCGDYASGTNHTLPTYGFARQYSGVNTLTFQKHITSQHLTEEGIRALGPIVVRMAECEGLEAHANAVRVRLAALKQ